MVTATETAEQRDARLWRDRRAEFYTWNSRPENCRCPRDREPTQADISQCERENWPVWVATLPADA